MSRIRLIGLLSAAILLVCSLPGCKKLYSREISPNIIFVMVDTLRADGLGCYGNSRPTSPYLDTLAQKGARFSNAFAHSTHTKVSIASMFTGMLPPSNGLRAVGIRKESWGESSGALDAELTTFAELFKKNGYLTMGISTNAYLQKKFGFAQGFDDFYYIGGDNPVQATAKKLNDQVLEWFDSKGKLDMPYFVYLHYMDVHYPYVPPKNYIESFTQGMVEQTAYYPNRPYTGPGMTGEKVDYTMTVFLAQIRYWDDQFRDMIEVMDKKGLLENTLIIVVSDHGEEFYEHGGFGHNYRVYDETLHVPLIICWPGVIPEGLVREDMAGIIDLFPTMAYLAGLDVSGIPLQGRNLFEDGFKNKSGPSKTQDQPILYAETFRISVPRCVRTMSQKLIFNHNTGEYEYYRLDRDPEEKNNLYKKGAPEIEKLSQILHKISDTPPLIKPGKPSNKKLTTYEKIRQQNLDGKDQAGENPPGAEGDGEAANTDEDYTPEMDQEDIKALRSLGYIY